MRAEPRQSSTNESGPGWLIFLAPPALTVPGVDEAGPESLETPRHLDILRPEVARPAGLPLALPEPPDGLPAEDVAGPPDM